MLEKKDCIKILCYNNYSMVGAKRGWEKGEYPDQHLWGTNLLLNHNIEVHYLEHVKYPILNKIGNFFHIKWLDQQLRILFLASKYDLIYSANSENTTILSIFKMLNLFNTPLLVLLHAIDLKSKKKVVYNVRLILASFYVRNIDRVIFLSQNTYKDLKEEINLPILKYCISWGCDLNFYHWSSIKALEVESQYFISAGHASRDFDILVYVFSKINYPLNIYCTKKSFPKTKITTKNILIDDSLPYDFTSPKLLLDKYIYSYAVLIPLKENVNGLQGLSSLLEAMAMGKAIVMTLNKNIDIDIEKEKIGIYVKSNDIEGWINAINYLLNNPVETKLMGNRARILCQNYYNMERFTNELAENIVELVNIDKNNKKRNGKYINYCSNL